MFAEKVTVVKDNYFPKQGQVQSLTESDNVMTDTIDEEYQDDGGSISKYAQAITKQLRK
jgi:hypothetical protein